MCQAAVKNAPSFAVVELDGAADPSAIWRVLQAAYAVESELLELADFEPLTRTEDEVRLAPTRFFGVLDADELVGVLELEDIAGATPSIASLGVAPSHHRRGVATRLIAHVCALLDERPLRVTSAARNAPALALYRRNGFCTVDLWRTTRGVAMLTLEREREGRSPPRGVEPHGAQP